VKRLPRINGHGLVRCSACNRWQDPSEYGYPPSLNGRPTAYCHGCQREIDRVRWRGERREKSNRTRIERKRTQRRCARMERKSFVKTSILTLRRRGLTKSEIVKLADVSFASFLHWERGNRLPDPQIAERFVILLRETSYLPIASDPVYRRRLPHPDLDALLERCRPKMLAFPVRSRWKARP
jgi:transcriptional regulator with XRE-family HTH domain